MPKSSQVERAAARSIVRKYESAAKANPRVPKSKLAAAMLPPVRDRKSGELRQRTPTAAAAQMRVYRQIAKGSIDRKATPVVRRARAGAVFGSGVQIAIADEQGHVSSFQIRVPEGSSTLDLFTPKGVRKLRKIAREHVAKIRTQVREGSDIDLSTLRIMGGRIVHVGAKNPYAVAL